MIGLILFNGFFVAAEVALIKLHSSQLDDVEEKDLEAAKLTRDVLDNLDRYIPACKFGASVAGVLLGAVSVHFLVGKLVPVVEKLGFNSRGIDLFVTLLISLGIVLALLVVIGKVIPNSIGFRRELTVSLKCSRILHWFYLVFALPIWLLTRVSNWVMESVLKIAPATERVPDHSAEDLRLFVEESGENAVTETEKEILINTLELNDLTVRDILMPRSDVVYLDIRESFEKNLERAIESSHTRFPLVDDHLDNTIGEVHIKDLIQLVDEKNRNLPKVKRDILRVDDEVKLDTMLKTFLEKKAHMALVVDQYGGACGLVILNDLLRVLVGDFEENMDIRKDRSIEKISDDEFLVPGSMPLHELDDVIPELDLDSSDVSTVGGYVTTVLGHLPKEGETAEIEGFRVRVIDANKRKIVSLRFERNPEGDTGAEEINPPENKVAAGSP